MYDAEDDARESSPVCPAPRTPHPARGRPAPTVTIGDVERA
ncbi:hypothetical protein [Streptomyces poonensis]|nr:hypothetical protein [Streptomyces poonensis]